MASRYIVPAFVLAVVAAGVGYWVAKDDFVTAAVAEATPAASSTAPASRTPTASNPRVADVGGFPILKSDVEQLYNLFKERAGGQQVPEQDKVFWMLVENLVNSRLIIQAAEKANMQDTAEVKQAISAATEQIVQEAYVQSLFKGLDNDATLRPLYNKAIESVKGQEEVRARHILVADEAKALELIKQLNGGAKFEDLAKANSTDPGSKDNGGDLGYFTKETMVPEFSTVAFALNKGQTSQTPVKSQFGYHIIKVEDRRAVTPPTYEQLKPQLLAQAQQEKLQQAIGTLRETNKVELFGAAGVPPVPAAVPTTDAPAAQ